MKLITVVLFILNFEGGQPERVTTFDTMEECKESFKVADSGGNGMYAKAKLVCVPVYRSK